MDDTRHMIIFDVLSWKSPVGEKGERLRLFLSDVGYAKAQASERRGEIKIRKHAAVIEGHILPCLLYTSCSSCRHLILGTKKGHFFFSEEMS